MSIAHSLGMEPPDHGSTMLPLPSLDEAELYFLVVQALLQSPFQHLGRQLAKGAQAGGLLPCRHDVFGKRPTQPRHKPGLNLCLATSWQ